MAKPEHFLERIVRRGWKWEAALCVTGCLVVLGLRGIFWWFMGAFVYNVHQGHLLAELLLIADRLVLMLALGLLVMIPVRGVMVALGRMKEKD